jgi:hypothetical protein
MISLIAKLRRYILGTVRMSLLDMIMMIRMTFPVVPNIKKIADIGISYGFRKLETFFPCSVSVVISRFVSVSLSSMGV